MTGGLGDSNLLHLPYHETPTFCWVVDGPDAMRRACRLLAREGVDLLKLNLSGDLGTSAWSSELTPMSEAEVSAATEVARARGLRVCAHCRSATRCGWRCAHGIEIIYHANYCDEPRSTRWRPRATASSWRRPSASPTTSRTPNGEWGVTPERARAFERELAVSVETIGRMRPRGIRVLPGGDYGFPYNPHGTYARDLWLFVEGAGLLADGDPGRRPRAWAARSWAGPASWAS